MSGPSPHCFPRGWDFQSTPVQGEQHPRSPRGGRAFVPLQNISRPRYQAPLSTHGHNNSPPTEKQLQLHPQLITESPGSETPPAPETASGQQPLPPGLPHRDSRAEPVRGSLQADFPWILDIAAAPSSPDCPGPQPWSAPLYTLDLLCARGLKQLLWRPELLHLLLS